MVFEFVSKKEAGAMAVRSEERLRRAKRRSERKILLAWMDSDVTDIPEHVLFQLDELILQRKKAIQAKWTPKDEAQRRGVDVTGMKKLIMSEGRLFESGGSRGSYDSDLFGDD